MYTYVYSWSCIEFLKDTDLVTFHGNSVPFNEIYINIYIKKIEYIHI